MASRPFVVVASLERERESVNGSNATEPALKKEEVELNPGSIHLGNSEFYYNKVRTFTDISNTEVKLNGGGV